MPRLIPAYVNTLLGLVKPNNLMESNDTVTAYDLVGTLYKSDSDWALLSVPNQVLESLFAVMEVKGVSLPYHKDGTLNGHISVIRDDEMKKVDPSDLSRFLGKSFTYTLGPIKTVNPDGWDGVDQVWFIECGSPELEKLRTDLGLTRLPKNNEFKFHITFALRKSDEE